MLETIRPIAIPLLTIVVLVALAVAILIFPDFLSEQVDETSDRIALASLFIETSGVIALLLAIWEFAQGQRKPKLKLWVQQYSEVPEQGGRSLGPMSNIISTWAPFDDIGAYFSLLIENHGGAVARWVNITVTARYPLRECTLYVAQELASGIWSQEGMSTVTFNGGDDFIVYERPQEVEDLRQWCSSIGILSIDARFPDDPDIQTTRLYIDCSIWADGFPRFDQTFTVKAEKPIYEEP